MASDVAAGYDRILERPDVAVRPLRPGDAALIFAVDRRPPRRRLRRHPRRWRGNRATVGSSASCRRSCRGGRGGAGLTRSPRTEGDGGVGGVAEEIVTTARDRDTPANICRRIARDDRIRDSERAAAAEQTATDASPISGDCTVGHSEGAEIVAHPRRAVCNIPGEGAVRHGDVTAAEPVRDRRRTCAWLPVKVLDWITSCPPSV